MRLTDRRAPTDENAGDRLTKQLVVGTLCFCAIAITGTLCWMGVNKLDIPDPLDRLITFIVGNLSGMLAKTGVDKLLEDKPIPDRIEVVAPPDEPLEVVETAPIDEPNEGEPDETKTTTRNTK